MVVVEDKSVCMGKVIVCCPACQSHINVTRPDSSHPFWSTNKPGKDEGVESSVVELLAFRKMIHF